MLSALPAGQASEIGQAPAPSRAQESTRPTLNPIDAASLAGAWKASRPDGSMFKLTLTKDANFVWSFSQKDQAEEKFGGTYSVERNVLALERKDGGSVVPERLT
ncbi:MAG: hypothetical protein U1A77_21465 [Pirellulales bacterium]